jgi:hypothetical protein
MRHPFLDLELRGTTSEDGVKTSSLFGTLGTLGPEGRRHGRALTPF